MFDEFDTMDPLEDEEELTEGLGEEEETEDEAEDEEWKDDEDL